MLILCDSIYKKELKPLTRRFPVEIIKKAAVKVANGLGVIINSKNNTQLIKCSLTGSFGVGRIIFLVLTNEKYFIPVIIRMKKDKRIGENMSMKNPVFKKELSANLTMVYKDLQNKNYRKIAF